MTETVIHERLGNVVRLTLNRPEVLNAMTDEMLDSVVRGIREAEDDDDIKAVVIRGAGSCFSSGWDLNEIGRMYGIQDIAHGERSRRPPQRNAIKLDRRRTEKYAAILYSTKTTISQVHGRCLGAAWMIPLVCDFVIAADTAIFAHTEQRLGASGTMWTLALEILHCGPKKARELMLTGRQFNAVEAERLNLINRAVPEAELEAEVDDLVKAICLLPRDGLAIGKAFTNMTYDMLGMTSAMFQYAAAHPLIVNLRWDPEEQNFPKERRDLGVRDAAHARLDRYPERYR